MVLIMSLGETVWIPKDLENSFSAIVSFLKKSFSSDVSCIGLYGSWQRGDVNPESDVDIVVFLNHEVNWFDAQNGIIDHSEARKDLRHWHTIEMTVNARQLDSRVYSVAVVTPAMLAYYSAHGPIHLQNWVHALRNCFPLWAAGSSDDERD